MKHSIIVFALVMFLGYLLGSFLMWDYNPGNWDSISRAGFAFISAFLALGVASANYK